MTDVVIVNGVTLTRAQVEQAMKELNSTPPFICGDRVHLMGTIGVVITGAMQRGYSCGALQNVGFNLRTAKLTIVTIPHGDGISYLDADEAYGAGWRKE